jgi:membrane dipeptidase
MNLIVDAHLDLAWNMLQFGRDYRRAAAETRRLEPAWIAAVNDQTMLGLPDMRRGRVALAFGSLYAAPRRWQAGAWETLVYDTPEQANRLYRDQIDVYHRLAEEQSADFRLIRTQADLAAHLDAWKADPAPPLGICILMEGAEGVRAPAELDEWWDLGVRLIGPAWAGNRFCGGTREPGPLTKRGFALLEAMVGPRDGRAFGLDLSHMDEAAVRQALDSYPGPVFASHANAHALLKGVASNRFLSDAVIRDLTAREGVIGIVPYAGFLVPGWQRGDRRELITLAQMVAQIDHICQLAGDAAHVGLGSDFDGGLGWEQVPHELDTIADLQLLAPLLSERGYQPADVAAILGENWLRLLRRVLP